MEKDKAIVIFQISNRAFSTDLVVPLNISANELVLALNSAYKLEMDTSNVKNCFLKAENPIALLKGNKTLADFGIRNGSVIYYTE